MFKMKKILEDIRNLKPELHKLKDEGSTDESSSVSVRSVVKSIEVWSAEKTKTSISSDKKKNTASREI